VGLFPCSKRFCEEWFTIFIEFIIVLPTSSAWESLPSLATIIMGTLASLSYLIL